MKKMMIVCASLFVMGIGSGALAGMLDQAIEATDKANTMAKDAKAATDGAEQKAIEAKSASSNESASMMDQAKDSVKETVNEKVNETIDSIGK